VYDRYGHEGLRSGGYAPNFESFGSVADIFRRITEGFDNGLATIDSDFAGTSLELYFQNDHVIS